MSDSIVKNQQEVYTRQFLEHGDSPEGTFNQNDVIQNLRFDRLIRQLDFHNGIKKLHDVGCGICDLYTYMQMKGISVEYSGTDVVQEMKELAIKKYPNIEFYVRDILKDDITEAYDYVTLAGVFNLPGETSREEWEKFTLNMISKMFDLCTKAISFNFLTAKADFYHPEMYYADPNAIFEYCSKNLSRHIQIDHSYPLFEFTVTVFKTEGMREIFTEQPLQKYLK